MRYRFGPFELRADTCELLRSGEPVPVGGRAFDLLVALVERRDRVVSSAELYKLVWPGVAVQPNNLQVQVWALRNLLGPHAIMTVARRGYRFVTEVEVSAPAAHERGERSLDDGPIEWALARDMLTRHRLVTLLGSDERTLRDLAGRIGPLLLRAVPDGVWGFEADRLEGPPAAAAGSDTIGQGPSFDTVLRRVAHSAAVLVLHNCHRAPQAASRAAQDGLARAPRLRVLATSLERLGLPGEGAVHLPRAWPLRDAAAPPGEAIGLRTRRR